MKQNTKAKKVAVGGVLAALSITLMMMTGIIPIGTYAFPVFAGMMLTVIVVELGYGIAFLTYAVVAILSFLIVADKEAALIYTVFFGFYPILKSLFERINSKVFQYVVKYALFNVCIISYFFLAVYIFGIPKESFSIFGVYLPLVFLAFGELFFIFYDMCVTVVVTKYISTFRGKLFR